MNQQEEEDHTASTQFVIINPKKRIMNTFSWPEENKYLSLYLSIYLDLNSTKINVSEDPVILEFL